MGVELWNIQETAKALRVCEKSVASYVKSGQLTAVRLGTALRFSPSDVADFISRKKVGPAAETAIAS
ncbi:MAG TPA: helix-turn-helix domain-containing protein [Phycisphaerae bacterium]|nr:helix-turn-helix domain-containing protein [Phycisphaerae bacterium]